MCTQVLQVWSSSRTTDLEPCQSGVEERGMSSHRRIEERGTSGGVSDEVGVEERGASGSRLSSRKESRGGRSSVARHSRLAKYTNHRLPDVSSRCASAMVTPQLYCTYNMLHVLSMCVRPPLGERPHWPSK